MIENARRWRILAGGVAAGMAGVLGLAGATAVGRPRLPQPPLPAPATVTQTVTAMPGAAAPVRSPRASGRRARRYRAAAVRDRPRDCVARRGAAGDDLPATSGTLHDFFKEKSVTLEPQDAPRLQGAQHRAADAARLDPGARPQRSRRVRGHRRPGRRRRPLHLQRRSSSSTSWSADFDPKEAISHGFIDSQQLPAWRATDASLADFGGMPSSLIEGTYRENNMTLNTSRRHVIATCGPGPVPGVAVGDHQRARGGRRRAPPPTPSSNGFKVSSPDAPRPHRRAGPQRLRRPPHAAAAPAQRGATAGRPLLGRPEAGPPARLVM